MSTLSDDDQRVLDVLRSAVAEALERKRRLGQYAVIWRDGKAVKIPRGEDACRAPGAERSRCLRPHGGKSILMVLIAKWLLEHDPEARILVITDRDELDKQIEGDEERRRDRPRLTVSPHYLAGAVGGEAR